ncbi:MAG: PAS domain S-box protein [Chromatiales bacterium]
MTWLLIKWYRLVNSPPKPATANAGQTQSRPRMARVLGPVLTLLLIVVIEFAHLDMILQPALLLGVAVIACGYYGGRGAAIASALFSVAFYYYFYSGDARQPLLAGEALSHFIIATTTTLLGGAVGGFQHRQSRRIRDLESEHVVLQGQLYERRYLEGALRQSEERHRRLMQMLPAAVLVVERNRITFVNDAALKLFGAISREQMLGRSPFDFIPGEYQRLIEEPIGQLLTGASEAAAPLVHNIARLDGSLWEAELSAGPCRYADSVAQAVILRDVSQYRRQVDSLRQGLERVRAVSELQPDGVFVLSPDAKLVEINRAGLNLLESDAPDPVQGRSLLEFLLPDHRQAFADLGRRVQQGMNESIEVEIQALEGSRRWLEIHAGPLRDGEQRCSGVVACARDITRRKRTEEGLRTSEQRFRALVEMSSDMTLILDPHGVILFASPSVTAILGYEPAQLIGKSTFDFVHHDDRIPAHSTLRDAVSNPGAVRRIELRVRHRDGSWRILEAFGRSHIDSPALHGVVVNCRDVTDRKGAEDALRESRERLTGILTSLDDVVWSSTVTDRQPLYVSPSAELVYGRAVGDFFAQPTLWFDVVHPDDQPRVRATVAQVVANGHYDYEYRIIRPDGSIRWLRDRARLVTDSFRRPLRLDGIASDITELKKAEVQLLESRERLRTFARQLDAAVEEERTHIARELHDELGQSLTGMKMDLAWMRRRLYDKSALRDASILHRKIASTGELIDSTIAVVRRIATRLRPTLLDNLGLTAAIEEYAAQFSERTGIPCDLALVADVTLDKARASGVFRILQEAMTNIARHSGASRAGIQLQADADSLTLELTDNGRGIDENNGAIGKTLGVLGMRERAQLMGGVLTVQRGAQGGALVRLTVPLRAGVGARKGQETCA